MSALIIVGLIVGLPFVLAILFRVSAVMIFLSVAIGSLMVKYFGYDFSVVLGSFVRNGHLDIITNLVLQLLPVGLTVIFLRKTIPRSQFIFHVVPLALACLALGALTIPLLSPGAQGAFYATFVGKKIQPATDLIIGAASLTVLFLAWFSSGKVHHSKKHH